MKKLLFFGDSWPHGDGLENGKQPFPSLVAEKLNCASHNYSQSSSSIAHLVHQLRYAVHHSKTTGKLSYTINDGTCNAIFFLTSPLRDLVFTNGKCKELHPHNPQDLDWYAKYSSDELHTYRTNTTILALQSLCDFYRIQSYYIWGWDKVDLWPEIDQTNFFHCCAAELFTDCYTNFLDLKNSNNKYLDISGHPNQMGHQLIADNLSKFLDEKLTPTCKQYCDADKGHIKNFI